MTERVVITFGTFDLLHIGHLNILEKAAELGDKLVVGVSSDNLNMKKKGRIPIIPQSDRMRIVGALSCVDQVFLEESLELKPEYVKGYKADVIVMGGDWKGKFDDLGITAVYLDRTPAISTTEIIEKCS